MFCKIGPPFFARLMIPCLAALAAACSATPQPQPTQPGKAQPSTSAVASAAPSASSAQSGCAIDGTVRGPAGAPVADAIVAVIAPFTDQEAAFSRTSESGAFCFKGLPPGEYGLTATSPRFTSAYVDVFPVGGDKGHGIEVKVGGEGFVLRGHVTDDAGRSIGKRVVRIARASTFQADMFVIESGDDGSYMVKLPGAEYRLRVESEDAAGVREGLKLDSDTTADIGTSRINPRSKPPPPEVIAWIKEKAIKLKSAQPGNGTEDMEPLRAVVGNSRVVALGEATHGTREFFQLKHRMLELLVDKMGFRTFAIEASFPEALAVDEYVRAGKGDAYSAVAGMRFWTWDTEEVVALVRWMRTYNEDKSHKEKLRFLGFDMQFPAGSAAALAAALKDMDKKLWAEVQKALEPIDDDWESGGFNDVPKAAQDAAEAAAKKLVARFEEKRESDVKKLKAEPFALARMHAHVLADYIEMMKKRGTDFGVRDRAMAENTLRLLEMLGPGSKMVLWAHNGHLQRRASGQQRTQGHILAEKLGKDYLPIGFAFDQGSFQAVETGAKGRGLTDFTIGAAPPGSLDGALATAGLPFFALDLRSATGASKTWLHTPTSSRTIGAVYSLASPDAFFEMTQPADMFDALFFVGKTTAARSTSTGKRLREPEKPPLPALTNGGFEDGAAGQAPAGWSLQSDPQAVRYRATLESKKPFSGKLAVILERAEPSRLPIGAGSLSQRIDAKPLRGKRVRVAARLRLEGKKVGDEAFVFARAGAEDVDARTLWQPAPSKGGWNEVAVELDVPPNADALRAGVVVTGAAKVGIDELSVTPLEKAK
jgi:erythromycin esterase